MYLYIIAVLMHLPSIAFCGTSVCQGSDFLQVSDLFLRSLWHSLQGVTHSLTYYVSGTSMV